MKQYLSPTKHSRSLDKLIIRQYNKVAYPFLPKKITTSNIFLKFPIQREVVRVGYEKDKYQNKNPFISGPHITLLKMSEKLKSNGPLYDYQDLINGDKVNKEKDSLYILGHGTPGMIGGISVDNLATNIQNKFTDPKFSSILIYSCFSNIKPSDEGNSAKDAFVNKFTIDKKDVTAASGLLYSKDEYKVLPPQYTGFKIGAKIAQEEILKLIDINRKIRISEIYKAFQKCLNPMDKFVHTNCTTKYIAEDSNYIGMPKLENIGILTLLTGLRHTRDYIIMNMKEKESEAQQVYLQCANSFVNLLKIINLYTPTKSI